MKKIIRKVSVQLDEGIKGIHLIDAHRVINNITRASLWRLQNLLGAPTDTWATIIIGKSSIRLTWRIYSEEQS